MLIVIETVTVSHEVLTLTSSTVRTCERLQVTILTYQHVSFQDALQVYDCTQFDSAVPCWMHPTSYQPSELDELKALWQTLPQPERDKLKPIIHGSAKL
jgi:hypothetical protein